MSSYDSRPSGCTPFFAHSTGSPAFDTAGMVHRTAAGGQPRRRFRRGPDRGGRRHGTGLDLRQ
ncbi:hypothetical protein ACRAWF_16690 [Streptomyces sp. L7]